MSELTIESENQIKVQIEPARDLLKQLTTHAPQGSQIELRTFSDKRDESVHPSNRLIQSGANDEQIAAALSWSVSENEQDKGVFIAYNPRREGTRGFGGKDDVEAMIAVFADLDVYRTLKTVDEAVDAIRTAPLVPHYVVNSGRGLQIIYLIQPTSEKVLWRMAQEGLYDHFKEYGADKAVVSDEARVLRLPGYLHLKAEPLQTSIIETNDAAPLHIADFLDYFSPEGAGDEDEVMGGKMPSRFRMPESIAEGEGRNNFLFKMGCSFRANGLSEEEIYNSLSSVNDYRCKPPLDDNELRGIARRAARYEEGTRLTESIAASATTNRASITEMLHGAMHTLDELETANTPEPEFILYSLAVGEIGAIYAKPSHGKTLVLRSLSLALATGQKFGDLYDGSEPVKVLYVDGEDINARITKDFKTMRANLTPEQREQSADKVRTLVTDDLDREDFDDFVFDLRDQMSQSMLIAAAKQHGAKLIILDTISALYSVRNENDNAEWKALTKLLKRIARQCNAALIFAHHVGKYNETDAGKDKMHAARGGSAAVDLARLAVFLEMSRADDGKQLLSMTYPKTKAVQRPGTVFEVDNLSRTLTERIDLTVADVEDVEYQRTLAVITKPMSKAEIVDARKNERSRTSIERDLKRGLDEYKIEQPKRGMYQPINFIPINPGSGDAIEGERIQF